MKRTIVSFAFFLLAITAGSGGSVQCPCLELRYPFFEGNGHPCSFRSTVANVGAGQIMAYDEAQDVCYWVSSLKIYGVPKGAKVSFLPNWHPAGEGSFMIDFWETPKDALPGGNESFWRGYPLPAGLGTLRVGEKAMRLYLMKGENVIHFP